MSHSHTVILGAGIIGCSTAYFLSQSPKTAADTIHLVDSSPELFCSASGLAGGFLAADWFAPSVAPLGNLSFRLHKQLAAKYGGDKRWGYSPSTGASLSIDGEDSEAVGGSGEDFLTNGTSRASAAGGKAAGSTTDGPAWLTGIGGASLEIISRDNSTAQIDPLRFSKFLLEECLARGVQLHHPAKAVSISKDMKDKLSSVRIVKEDSTETDLPCTRLLIAAGAWSPKVFSTLFPKAPVRIPIAPLAGHSLLLKTPRWTEKDEESGCHAVFATETLGFSPELFSRRGGEIYIAGLNSTMIPMPELATAVKVDNKAMQQLRDCARRMVGLPEQDDLQILRESICFRPVTSSGRPIISRVPDEKLGGEISTLGGAEGGVFIAAGHGAWGISQAPGTGFVMTELMEGRSPSVNITALALP